MIVIGILGAVAAGRFFERSFYDTAGFSEQAQSLIRYGQKAAIAQNRPVYVFVEAGRVALCYGSDCAAANRVKVPGGNSASTATLAACSNDRTWACEGRPNAVAMALSPSAPYTPNAYFTFDAGGVPAPATGGTSFSPLTITFTSGADTQTVRVEQETGYVY
jgi:MSHA pilin protein MshC